MQMSMRSKGNLGSINQEGNLCFNWTRRCNTTANVLRNTAVLLLITQECNLAQQRRGYFFVNFSVIELCNTAFVLHLTQL